ncbi:MAG: sulfotransferase [Planctomycetaceae bacterium]|nr:sulfotransferase [Planctomycetaceae bacterium]
MTATLASPPAPKPAQAKANPYPWYSPRFWHGMRPAAWWALLWRHRFRIHPLRWPMAFLISVINPINTMAGAAQRARFGRLIDQTRIDQPPVFIIGHWRSGTTYLHELMHLDARFVSPTTYQCFAPHHFLLTEWLMVSLGRWLLPKQRPMDNMAAGWDRPQEDEFALLTLGAPTPYLRMAFPNDPPPYSEFLDMQGCSAGDLARFERALVDFVKLLTFASPGKRLLLKSPPHTGRIEILTRLFPGARFIHITRSPYSLFPSTTRLWHSIDEVQGLQFPKDVGLEEYVFDCLNRMYRGFEDQRQRLDPAAVYDVRYEDLVADPVGEIGQIYESLGLGDYSAARNAIAVAAGQQKDYKTNKHELDESLKARIRERWSGYFERYGYE